MSTARTIDLWMGLVLFVLGVVGLFLTQNGVLFGFLNTSLAMQIVYIAIGGVLIFAYYSSTTTAHTLSALVGIFFAALGIVGFFNAFFWGLPVSGWNILVNLFVAVVLIYDWLATPEVRHST